MVNGRQNAAIHFSQVNCPRCAAELAELRRLSELAASLGEPLPSRPLNGRVLRQPRPLGDGPTSKRRTFAVVAVLIAVAATTAIVTWIGATWRHQGHAEHDDLAQYWESFQSNPLTTQKDFLTRHAGRIVSPDDAVREVGYRPLATAHVPDAVIVEASYLLNMPCCKCIETICRRADETALAVFEHEEEQPDWFPNRAQITAKCADKQCRVTQLDSCLAASWPVGNRVITVVGLRDVDELNQWVIALG